MAEPDSAPPPLRVCLLSGGASRRMGRDKALLPHPEGGCWLERTLRLLAALQLPITLLSRHPEHLLLARRLGEAWGRLEPDSGGLLAASPPSSPAPSPCALPPLQVAGEAEVAPGAKTPPWAGLAEPRAEAQAARGSAVPPLEALAEPPPWEGPLLALHRLMQRHPQQRLLLCPVDMPWLTLEALQRLVAASEADPMVIQLAHDGERLQPLLGIYPGQACRRSALGAAIAKGERRLQTWLADQPCRALQLDTQALRNVNRPQQWWSD